MLIKLQTVHNKKLKRFLEHSVYLLIVFILVPGFVYFELCVVLPTVVEIGTVPYIIHYVCAAFLLFNIVGNLIYGMFTDTSIRGKIVESEFKENWTVCTVCECLRPPRAWHCDTCDTCILKRDHHCTFFACCVGYYNHRYFMFFTLYTFISMVYAFSYNVIFLCNCTRWNHGLILAKFAFPLVSFVIDFGEETLYVFLIEINFIIGAFTGALFIFHFNNILNGRITPEKKDSNKVVSYDNGTKQNVIEVFGYKWYLSWISPFINSPLPGNGVEWNVEDKHK